MSTRVRQEPISPLSARSDLSMRLDQSHATDDRGIAADLQQGMTPAAATGEAMGDEAQAADARLATHAQQLSLELNHRLREIDARELELNTRLSEFDAEMRRSRLWLDDKRQELAEREAELNGKSADQQSRLERVMAAEADLQARREALPNVAEQHDRVGQTASPSVKGFASHSSFQDAHVESTPPLPAGAVRMSDAEVDERIIDLKARLQAARQQLAEAQQRAEAAESKLSGTHAGDVQRDAQLAEQRRKLDEAEALVAAEAQQLADERLKLDQARADLAEQSLAERRTLESLRAKDQAEAAARRSAIAEQQEQLDARAHSLDALRRELSATQRETLEMRVATQEVWLQLSGRLAPAHLIQQLATVRGQLAEHHRSGDQHLEATRDELRQAGERLAEQLHRLKQQRGELEQWACEQHASIERQAARLVAREQQLDAQEAELRAASRKWEEQRLGLQREIRRLLAEGRRVRAS